MGMQGIIPPNIDYNKNVSDRYEKKIYKKGETCIKYNKLHQAKENIDAPEEWNPVHWEETTVEQIRAQIQQKLSVVNTNIANITPDDTDVDGKPWTSKHIVDMLCPPLKVSGNPVQCYPVEGYPLGITASWEPTQEGTGDPSPDNIRPIKGRDSVAVTRCGANLAGLFKTNTISGITYTASENSVNMNGTVPSDKGSDLYSEKFFLPEGRYQLSLSFSGTLSDLFFSLDNSADFMFRPGSSPGTKTGELKTGLHRFYIYVNKGATLSNYSISFSITPADADVSFEPPISQSITLTLPETIYGGSVDAVSGQGQKKWESIAISNIKVCGTFTYGGQLCYRLRITNCQKIICNKLKRLVNWKSPMSDYSIELQNPNYLNVVMYVPGLTTEAEYKAWISENEPIAMYEYISGIPFEASGAKNINALSGVNTVLTDADIVEVTGREDLIHAISKQ